MRRSVRRPISWGPQRGRRSGAKLRLLIAGGIAIFALVSFLGRRQINQYTGEKQFVALVPQQEIALGLQAAPQMMAEYGGLDPDAASQMLIDRIGQRLVDRSDVGTTPWQFEFHLLADPGTVNAFALPGGQIFMTDALFRGLETEGQVAGVLGHEIGHVIARHSAQRMAKQSLTQGLIGAVAVASESASQAEMAEMVGAMVNMKYGRGDELESDTLGVMIMAEAGYDPRAMIAVMDVLEAAGGGARQADFFSTHPSPDNRRGEIRAAIDRVFPNGVPDGLTP